MLTQIEIANYKSYRDKQTLPLAPLTLLIGANASGKSNALEALRLLSWFSRGERLASLEDLVNQSDQFIRGVTPDLIHDAANTKANAFKLGCITDDEDWNHFAVELEFREDELHIRQESITSDRERFPLYRIEDPPEGMVNEAWVAYNNFAKGGRKPQISCIDQMAIMQQLSSPARFDARHKRSQKVIPKVTSRFRKLLEHCLFLDPVPSMMRDKSLSSKQLKSDGSNLAGVLHHLSKDKDKLQAILKIIKSLPEQDIKGIKFYKGKFNEQISFAVIETFNGARQRMPAELLSDGTLRVLAIAVALMSTPEGATLVIEEIDNSVHPTRAKDLLATLQEFAEQRNLRLLFTTHNPAMMDAVPNDALSDVVFCYRCPKTGTSQLRRLSDQFDYIGLMVRGSMGHLVTSGRVDKFVKNPTTPEKKRKAALDWLARMRAD